MRVFGRVGLVSLPPQERAVVLAARALHPKFPGENAQCATWTRSARSPASDLVNPDAGASERRMIELDSLC